MIKDFQNCWWLGERFTSLPYNPAVMTDDYVLSYEELYKKSFIAAGFLKARGITAGSNAGILYSHNYNYYIIIAQKRQIVKTQSNQ